MSADLHILDELEWRGLIAHSTDLDALRAELSGGMVKLYCGFDPTAPSLHMGNLLQILTLRRFQDAGHKPYGLVGGATGMIGDPKDTGERQMNSLDTVKQWSANVKSQLKRFLSFEGSNAASVVNNYDWTAGLSTIEFLRDIGKHFPVNRMLAREVVKARLEIGISYTEFSYVLLQSMDYLNLYRDFGVTLQTGGSDQWGNITAGVDLIRRVTGGHVNALATPLVTKADGTKFGKTESGTVWLDASMTSPYAFYQFWLNSDDRDVVDLLRYYTFRTREEIAELEEQTREKPFMRAAQRALADDVTTLVHGAEETERIKAASAALFGGGELTELSVETLGAALREAGSVQVKSGEGMPSFVDLLVETGLVASKGAARRTISEGGAYLNNRRVADPELVPTSDDLIGGAWMVLRRGKKHLAGVEVVAG
ncbi:MAG TPA: tyrosine--tRNA ligase [Nocardioidaceae bacterium]|nr:tyrosine--tRNA ligase [Nocardioidaceae bacterium]